MPKTPQPPEPRGLLEGKRVLITAAAGSGIGGATARRCALEGATVIISDRHERRLNETADAFADDFGTRPLAVPCDVTRQEDVDRLFDATLDAHGGVDVMVNNAGLGGMSPLVEMSDEEWHRVLDVTLTGTFRCVRAAMRHMVERGSGTVVNNASVLGWRAQAEQAHYAAAKAGVMALTRSAAMEAAPHDVRVNAVAPSIAMHDNLARASSDDLLERLAGQEAFGRAAEPWEVANVIIFLASDLSTYMTGETVSVSSQHP